MTEQKLWTRSFVIITVENFLIAMNFIVLVAVVAKFATAEFGASTTLAGFAAGIFILGAVFTRPVCGKWIYRIGQKRMLRRARAGCYCWPP